jgi:hypothetical protein
MVLAVKTSMKISVAGSIKELPFEYAGFYGMCPVFITIDEAKKYADGKAEVVEVMEIGKSPDPSEAPVSLQKKE